MEKSRLELGVSTHQNYKGVRRRSEGHNILTLWLITCCSLIDEVNGSIDGSEGFFVFLVDAVMKRYEEEAVSLIGGKELTALKILCTFFGLKRVNKDSNWSFQKTSPSFS